MLAWIDTQRRTSPEDLWKNTALKHFSAEEITNAKNTLWEVAKEGTLERNIGRKGESKSTSELNDICEAFKILSEKQVMPTFISTSTMILQSPPLESAEDQKLCTLSIKLDTIEESLEKFSKKLSEQSSKNHDRILSKSEVTNKKVDSLAQRLFTAEDNLGQNTQQRNPTQNNNTMQQFNERNNLYSNTQPEPKYPPWNTVQPRRNSWDANNRNKNDDISVVIKGVDIDVTSDQINQFLSSNGVNAKECLLLTKYEYERFLSYKITVTARDHETVKDLSIWPENISIEPYKERKGRNIVKFQTNTRNNDKNSNDSNKSKITGILKRPDNTNRNVIIGDRTGEYPGNLTIELSNVQSDRQIWLRQPNKSA